MSLIKEFMKVIKDNFITDVEILKWNDILKENRSNYLLRPVNSNYHQYYDIDIDIIKSPYSPLDSQYEFTNPFGPGELIIDYNFTFSVSKSRLSEFNKILNEIKGRKIKLNVSFNGGGYESINIPKELDCVKEDHMVLNKEYTRFQYKFYDNIVNIMLYVSFLRDTIEFFKLIYGYDADGVEYNLLDHPIGSVVSLIKDKSRDYLVLDYEYSKNTNSEYSIYYKCCEILNQSAIIEYGDVMIFHKNDISFSRNSRIDDILKN